MTELTGKVAISHSFEAVTLCIVTTHMMSHYVALIVELVRYRRGIAGHEMKSALAGGKQMTNKKGV